MGVFAGPDVSESGLVLALDGANYKSFKGESTTNELVAITWAGDGTAQAGMSLGPTAVTEEYLKYKGYETYLWSPGSSLNCYLNGGDVDVNRTSTVWTFSCYVKREDGAAITSLNVYMYYPTSDGSAAGTIENVGNGWYRVSRTRTGASSNITLAGFTGFVAGYKYYLSGAQLEKKSYATTPATVNTTRGTTVATGGGWANMIANSNNGELFNGVRENSANSGSLSFDGTDDYVSSGALSGSFASFTVVIWFYPTSVTNYQNPIDCNYAYNGSTGNVGPRLEMATGGVLAWIYSNDIANNAIFYSHPVVSSGLAANTWHYAAITYNGGTNTSTTYYNGNATGLSRTLSGTPTGFVGVMNNVTIGKGFHLGGAERIFAGRIPSVSVYNRALTASEIRQNFNATRSRYGI